VSAAHPFEFRRHPPCGVLASPLYHFMRTATKSFSAL
jgi:hypothetical protein